MSTPTTPADYPKSDPVLMAFAELGSARSSLNMESRPIFGPFDDACGPEGYLSSNEYFAKHACEHLDALGGWLNEVNRENARLKNKLFRMERMAAKTEDK